MPTKNINSQTLLAIFCNRNSTKISDLIKYTIQKAPHRGTFSFNNLIVQFINRFIVEKVLNFVSSLKGLFVNM